MNPIVCHSCGESFVPRAKGFNARYCSETCKRRAQRARLKLSNPEQLVLRRARSYNQTKKYPERLSAHRATARRYRKEGRDWLRDYKMKHGCVDCGYRQHHAALQLDHEGPKAVAIADARTSVRRLQAEIEAGQCKVRCANCHSIRTWERKRELLGAVSCV